MSASTVDEYASELHFCINTVPQVIYLTLYYALAH